MKKIIFALLCALCAFCFQSCGAVTPDAEEEAVLIDKPWFFGHGGVREKAVTTGLKWVWVTTDAVYFKNIPVRYDEKFDDIFSNNNTPLDFDSYITIQINSGKSPVLLQNYGAEWYKNNIQVPYRNYTREEVSKYSPFDLISNREILNEIDAAVLRKMNSLLASMSSEKEFPIVIKSVVTGAAKPNKDQLEEMNITARNIQAKESQSRAKEMHEAREAAEMARAEADKAYMKAMSMTADQFIQLKYIEMISEKKDAQIDVLIGSGAMNMWNIKR